VDGDSKELFMRTVVLATAISALALSFAAPASAAVVYDVVSGFTGNPNDGSSVWT
jgi:hypothetical protein